MKRILLILALLALPAALAAAGEEAAAPPPLPLHTVEGCGGTFTIESAYLVNPAPDNGALGLPSVGTIWVHAGSGKTIEAYTVTETLFNRLELGYAFNTFAIGDLGQDVLAATGVDLDESAVDLHVFNARLNLLREGQGDLSWLPAVTTGVHYKSNDTLSSLDRQLGGALTAMGIEDDQGVDYTLFATKMLTNPLNGLPIVLSAGMRATKAAHLGFLGFTDEYVPVAEGGACFFVLPQVALAAEYRQKPDEYVPVPGLIGPEDDWYSFCCAYIANEHLVIAGGYANFGEVLNHVADGSFGLEVKYEF